MPAGVGVPIRLVRNDGELIPLLAESITMTVERSVGSMAMPFTGSTRFGMDLNMSKAAIVIQGVFVDDALDRALSGTNAFGDIDFAVSEDIGIVWLTGAGAATLATVSPATYEQTILLLDSDGNNHKMRLTNGFNVGTGPTTDAGDTMLVHIGNSTTAAQVSGALVTALNQTTHPSGVSHRPGNFFTATQVNSEVASTATGGIGVNSRVRIEHDTAGVFGGKTPSFSEWNDTDVAGPNSIPRHTPFRGGKVSGASKSAGDKAMDLWGTLNNMNDGGLIVGSIGAALTILTGGSGGAWDEADGIIDFKYGDYIIGIQIPYHSLVQATGGEDYVQRNFFMPTGAHHNKLSKDSEANENSVDVEFKSYGSKGDYTGIKGTVQQFMVTYDAGETVYKYQMTFLPIDWIV